MQSTFNSASHLVKAYAIRIQVWSDNVNVPVRNGTSAVGLKLQLQNATETRRYV